MHTYVHRSFYENTTYVHMYVHVNVFQAKLSTIICTFYNYAKRAWPTDVHIRTYASSLVQHSIAGKISLCCCIAAGIGCSVCHWQEFESQDMVFPASFPQEPVYRSMTIWNRGTTPALFEVPPDPDEWVQECIVERTLSFNIHASSFLSESSKWSRLLVY